MFYLLIRYQTLRYVSMRSPIHVEIGCLLQGYWLSNMGVTWWSDLNMVLGICNNMKFTLVLCMGSGHGHAPSNTTFGELKIQRGFLIHDFDHNKYDYYKGVYLIMQNMLSALDVFLCASAGASRGRYHAIQPYG